MLSKQKISYIRSLHQKKFRQMYGKFLVEGAKQVSELLAGSFKTDAVYSVSDWSVNNLPDGIEHHIITAEEIRKISTQENPDQVIAVVNIPDKVLPSLKKPALYIACDGLNDPGNAGSIIRIADWFGISDIFFSTDSVEAYNPKVVAAAKGSLFRVGVHYTALHELFLAHPDIPVYGTFMNGENIYTANLADSAIILIGNESKGIGEELWPLIKNRISIPAFGKAESLNAAVAAGIVVSEFARRLNA